MLNLLNKSALHTHSTLTTHLILRGEITLREEGNAMKTFKQGDRVDVGANVKHEAWVGPQVPIPRRFERCSDQVKGCTYVIGEQ